MEPITLQIKPLDTLFFRDGRPFGAIGDLISYSLDLPIPPSYIYGALQSYFVSNLNKIVDFEILNIFYTYKNSDLTICPSILLQKKHIENKESREVLLLSVKKYDEGKNGINYLFWSEKSDFKYLRDLINISDLIRILKGQNIEKANFYKNQFIKRYFKVGNKRNDLIKNVEESKLFSYQGYELDNFSIKVKIKFNQGIDINDSVIIKLGAENKVALTKVLQDKKDKYDDKENVREVEVYNENKEELKTKNILIYFSTPTIYRNLESLEKDLKELFNAEGKIAGYALTKPRFLGGFDIKQGKPKIMYRTISEGSVFFFKADKKEIELNKFQGAKLLDSKIDEEFTWLHPNLPSLKKQGFGIAYFGNIKVNDQ